MDKRSKSQYIGKPEYCDNYSEERDRFLTLQDKNIFSEDGEVKIIQKSFSTLEKDTGIPRLKLNEVINNLVEEEKLEKITTKREDGSLEANKYYIKWREEELNEKKNNNYQHSKDTENY